MNRYHRALLKGGPYDGHRPEVAATKNGAQPNRIPLMDGGFVYTFDHVKGSGGGRVCVYLYDPDESRLHAAVIAADAAAVAEVAEQEGITPAALLARAEARRGSTQPHPAALLLAEARRRNVPVEVLLSEQNPDPKENP